MTTIQLDDTVPKSPPSLHNVRKGVLVQCILKKVGKERTSTFGEETLCTSFDNGFVAAAFHAYSDHHHLVLRPDDLWLAIVRTFSDYVNAHSEEMRHLFVSHSVKKDLEVVAVLEDWNEITEEFSKQLPAEVRRWVMPDFSTTSQKDKLCASVALMATMKSYYSYRLMLMCGMPAVTLLGTASDWEEIVRRAEKLTSWAGHVSECQKDLESWKEMLVPVLRKLVAAHKGEQDGDFWQSISNRVSRGSGPRYLSGWLNAFLFFKDGKRALAMQNPLLRTKSQEGTATYGYINTKDVPCGVLEVPIQINDQGDIFDATLYAGAFGAHYAPESNKISARSDFLVVRNK